MALPYKSSKNRNSETNAKAIKLLSVRYTSEL